MKQAMLPNTKEFYEKVYPCLSDEGQRKADRLLDEYGLRDRYLTKEESAEARHMLVQIVKAHTVKPMPRGSWSPSWQAVFIIVVVNILSFEVVINVDWSSVFTPEWMAAAVLGILGVLLIAFYKTKGTG